MVDLVTQLVPCDAESSVALEVGRLITGLFRLHDHRRLCYEKLSQYTIA